MPGDYNSEFKIIPTACFSVLNKFGTPDLYYSPDINYNKLTFSITNRTKAELDLKKTAGKASSFTFGFSNLLSDSIISSLVITLPPGWKKDLVELSPGYSMWQLTCTEEKKLAIEQKIDFIIEHISLADSNGTGAFEILYKNIPGYNDLDGGGIRLPMGKKRPPKDKPLVIGVSYKNVKQKTGYQSLFSEALAIPSESVHNGLGILPVYIPYSSEALIRNSFTLVLINNRNTINLSPSKEGKPTITISFPFGRRDYDITTQDRADANITMDVNSPNWKPVQHIGGNSYWQFDTDTKRTINPYEEIASFTINNIVTPVDVAEGSISNINIQLNNFDVFDDGTYILTFQKKKAKAGITSLKTDKPILGINENAKLSWQTSLARRVTISYQDRDGKTIRLDSEAADGQYQIKIDATDFELPVRPDREISIITATAYDNNISDLTQAVFLTVKQPYPAITGFTANPQVITAGQKTRVDLKWNVTDGQRIFLLYEDKNIEVTGTSTSVEIDSLCTFTLRVKAYGSDGRPDLEQHLTVFACATANTLILPLNAAQPKKQILPVFTEGGYIRLKEIFVQNPTQNLIETIAFMDESEVAITVPYAYPGSVCAANYSGTKLAIYNYDPNDATKCGIILRDQIFGYASKPVNVSGSKNNIVTLLKFSPDSKKLYVVYNAGAATMSDLNSTINATNTNGPASYMCCFDVNVLETSISQNKTAPVELKGAVTDIIFKYYPEKLMAAYFAPYNDNVLYQINWENFQALKKIVLGRSKIIRIVEARRTNKIYVLAEDDPYIASVDTKNELWLGGVSASFVPSEIAISPDERTLFAASFKDNKVEAIDLMTKTKLTWTSIDTPSCLAPTADGKMLFVGNYCSKKLTLINLGTGELANGQISTGEQSANPIGIMVIDEKESYRVFVGKEYYPARTDCKDKGSNTDMNSNMFFIRKKLN